MVVTPSAEAVGIAYQEYVRGSMDSALAAAYAIDAPRIEQAMASRVVAWMRDAAPKEWDESAARAIFEAADAIAREFGGDELAE